MQMSVTNSVREIFYQIQIYLHVKPSGKHLIVLNSQPAVRLRGFLCWS